MTRILLCSSTSEKPTSHPASYSSRHPAVGYDRTCIRRLTASEYARELEGEAASNPDALARGDERPPSWQQPSARGHSETNTERDIGGDNVRKQPTTTRDARNRPDSTPPAHTSARAGLLSSRHPNVVFSSKYPVYNRLGQELCVLYQAQALDVSNELRRVASAGQWGGSGSGGQHRMSSCRQSCVVPLTDDPVAVPWRASVELLRGVLKQDELEAEKEGESTATCWRGEHHDFRSARATTSRRTRYNVDDRVSVGCSLRESGCSHSSRHPSTSTAPPSRSCSSRPSVFSIYRESKARQSVCSCGRGSRGSRPTPLLPWQCAEVEHTEEEEEEALIGEKRRRVSSATLACCGPYDKGNHNHMGGDGHTDDVRRDGTSQARDDDKDDTRREREREAVCQSERSGAGAEGGWTKSGILGPVFQRVRRYSPTPVVPPPLSGTERALLLDDDDADEVAAGLEEVHRRTVRTPLSLTEEVVVTRTVDTIPQGRDPADDGDEAVAAWKDDAPPTEVGGKEMQERRSSTAPVATVRSSIVPRLSAASNLVTSVPSAPPPYSNPLQPALYGGVAARIVPFSSVAEAMELALKERCKSLFGNTDIVQSVTAPCAAAMTFTRAAPSADTPEQLPTETTLAASVPAVGLGRPTPPLTPGETVLLGEDCYRICSDQHVGRVPTDVWIAMSCSDERVEALLYRWRRPGVASCRSRHCFQPAETWRAALGLGLLSSDLKPQDEEGRGVEVRGFAFSDGGITVVRLPRHYHAVPLSRVAATVDAGGFLILLRLLLKMVSTLLARRVVHGRMDALDQIWLAVPLDDASGVTDGIFSSSPSSCSAECHRAPLLLPLHWERGVDFSMFADRNVGGRVPLQFDDTPSVSPTPLLHSSSVRAEVALSTTSLEVRHGTDLRTLLYEVLSMPAAKGLENHLYCMAQQLLLRAAEPSPAAAQLVLPLQRFLRELPCVDNECDSCVAMVKGLLNTEGK